MCNTVKAERGKFMVYYIEKGNSKDRKDINKIENINRKINKNKSWFYKDNNIYKHLACLVKEKKITTPEMKGNTPLQVCIHKNENKGILSTTLWKLVVWLRWINSLKITIYPSIQKI